MMRWVMHTHIPGCDNQQVLCDGRRGGGCKTVVKLHLWISDSKCGFQSQSVGVGCENVEANGIEQRLKTALDLRETGMNQ